MVFDWTRRLVPLSLLVLAAPPALAADDAVLDPNQIVGRVAFSNTNSEILAVLDQMGISYARINGRSLNFNPTLNAYTVPRASSSTQVDYELTVESSMAGIVYAVTPQLRLNRYTDFFYFEAKESAGVQPEPAPDRRVDFSECATLLQINWQDDEGTPVRVQAGQIHAYAAPNRQNRRAWTYQVGSGISQRDFLVPSTGANASVYISYAFGTDIYSDLVNGSCTASYTATCDATVPVTCIVPRGQGLVGTMSGTVDMLGAEEIQLANATRVVASDGPGGNGRWAKIAASPSSGAYTLPNMVPSGNDGYRLSAVLMHGSGYELQLFRSPTVIEWQGGAEVPVVAGGNTELGDMFVFDPGTIRGDIRLTGPRGEDARGWIQHIVREYDRWPNGVPNRDYIYYSHVSALGSYGAEHDRSTVTVGGHVQASFRGDPSASSIRFDGDYELQVAGLYRGGMPWNPNALTLHFGDAAEALNTRLKITDRRSQPVNVEPGQVVTKDHGYCLSEVELHYRAESGSVFYPSARGSARSIGVDDQGQPFEISGQLLSAYGSPRHQAEAGSRAKLNLLLTRGLWSLTPSVRAVNPGGGYSDTQLPPIELDVDCNQRVVLSTDLKVIIDDIDSCSEEGGLPLRGRVESDGAVTEIVLNHNGREQVLCRDCGVDPTFSTRLDSQGCGDHIVVVARDEYGNEASISRGTGDGRAPRLVGCEDIKAHVSAVGGAGTEVSFDVRASDLCQDGSEVVCDHESGDYFKRGKTEVSCTGTDPCGNEAACSFEIEVLDYPVGDGGDCNTADIEIELESDVTVEMLWPPNHDLVEVGLVHDMLRICTTEDRLIDESDVKMNIEVYSDETELPTQGDGTGHHAPDAKTNTGELRLRADRSAKADGRVYLIISRAVGPVGDRAATCSAVVVPHDLRDASIASVMLQAERAVSQCQDLGGMPPRGFHRHGISEPLGPKQ